MICNFTIAVSVTLGRSAGGSPMRGADMTISAKEIRDRSRARSARGPDHPRIRGDSKRCANHDDALILRELIATHEGGEYEPHERGGATDEGCAPRARRMEQCRRISSHDREADQAGGYYDDTGAVAERRGILGAARAARAAPPRSASKATRRHLRRRATERKRTTVNLRGLTAT